MSILYFFMGSQQWMRHSTILAKSAHPKLEQYQLLMSPTFLPCIIATGKRELKTILDRMTVAHKART
ncbi:MAG TPA: hypothetical protein VKF36_07360 [Syntrophorhabdales bacterium]|nr:hypothetical protein [Syntrophorhabdales bacterium]